MRNGIAATAREKTVYTIYTAQNTARATDCGQGASSPLRDWFCPVATTKGQTMRLAISVNIRWKAFGTAQRPMHSAELSYSPSTAQRCAGSATTNAIKNYELKEATYIFPNSKQNSKNSSKMIIAEWALGLDEVSTRIRRKPDKDKITK